MEIYTPKNERKIDKQKEDRKGKQDKKKTHALILQADKKLYSKTLKGLKKVLKDKIWSNM